MNSRQQSPQFLTQTELRALLDRAKRSGPREYAMLLIAYRHGLRASEICNLTFENVDLEAGNIRCQRGKGEHLQLANAGRGRGQGSQGLATTASEVGQRISLFLSRKGNPLSRCQFFRLFRALAEEAGLGPEKRHPHILKHSLGTHLANAGLALTRSNNAWATEAFRIRCAIWPLAAASSIGHSPRHWQAER